MNQTAPTKATIDATMSTPSGYRGHELRGRVRRRVHREGPGPRPGDGAVDRHEDGESQIGSGTRSRAYWSVNGRPMASETKTMLSEARVDREPHGGHRPPRRGDQGVDGERPKSTKLPTSRILMDSPRRIMRGPSSTETTSAPMSPAIGETRRISTKKTMNGERPSRTLMRALSEGDGARAEPRPARP